VQTSQNVPSNSSTATVIFLPASNLTVNVKDAKNGVAIDDYRWIIEEDKTFWIDPKCQVNVTVRPLDSNGRACPDLPVESSATTSTRRTCRSWHRAVPARSPASPANCCPLRV